MAKYRSKTLVDAIQFTGWTTPKEEAAAKKAVDDFIGGPPKAPYTHVWNQPKTLRDGTVVAAVPGGEVMGGAVGRHSFVAGDYVLRDGGNVWAISKADFEQEYEPA